MRSYVYWDFNEVWLMTLGIEEVVLLTKPKGTGRSAWSTNDRLVGVDID